MEINDDQIKQQMQEALVNYFMALTGDPESLTWLLTHPEQNLRELGEMMVAKQKQQPQKQIEDAYQAIEAN